MAAPKGNTYWKLARNPGRPRIFKTPDELWYSAQEYFKWCDDNPDYKIEMLKKSILEEDLITGEFTLIHYVSVPVKRAYLWSGLCLYLGVDVSFFTQFENGLDLSKEEDKEFYKVVRAIRDTIKADQVTGGLNGTLNANLVARLQGIAEKRELESKNVNTNDDIDYDQLDDETLEKIAKAKIKK
jgi:hypothetical protein